MMAQVAALMRRAHPSRAISEWLMTREGAGCRPGGARRTPGGEARQAGGGVQAVPLQGLRARGRAWRGRSSVGGRARQAQLATPRPLALALEQPQGAIGSLLDFTNSLPHVEALRLTRRLAVELHANERAGRQSADEAVAPPGGEFAAVINDEAGG